MGALDPYLKQVATYVAERRRDGRPVRTFRCDGDCDALREGLPLRVGPGANAGLILRADTFAELGSPDAGSAAFPLWTRDASLLRDGRITLIGPGIRESEGARLPFGQVLMIGGAALGDEEHEALEQNQYVADQIEGYMIRSTPGRIWSRVGHEAASRGFDFDFLGRALMLLYKTAIPKIESMEVLFVTSGKEDLEPLRGIAEQVRTLGALMSRNAWLARGYDILECTLGVDCRSCSDKPTCDDIRDVVKIRKKKIGKAAHA